MPINFISNQLKIDGEGQQYTVLDCLKWCLTKSVIGVDTETTGLNFLSDKVIMLQIGDEETQWVIDTRNVDVSPLKEVFTSSKILKIFHNVKFDYKFILSSFGFKTENVYDTMLVDQVIHGGKSGIRFGLNKLIERYFKVDLSKEERLSFLSIGARPFTQNQIVYGAKDVEYLVKIKREQEKIFKGQEYEPTIHLENEASLSFADIEYNGIGLDTERWLSVARAAQKDLEKQQLVLDSFLINDFRFNEFIATSVQADLFIPVSNLRTVNVLWTSPSQVLKVMKKLIPDIPSVGVDVLFPYVNKFDLVKEYLKYKKIQKRVTSYGKTFIDKYLLEDGRIHTRFKQILDTGRVSSADPNMQQIPGTNTYRNCFTTGIKDWVFVSSDYSSQELCVIAVKSKDPVWLKVLENGEDLHSTAAELVYGKKWKEAEGEHCDYYKTIERDENGKFIRVISDEPSHQKCECPKHKKLRTAVKSINFGLAYGMSAFKLHNDLQISIEEAEKLIEDYFSTFPAIKKFLEVLGNHGTKHGFIKTFPPFFRRRYFSSHADAKSYLQSGSWESKKEGNILMGKIERASKNMPIQGSSADMTKRALILMRNYLRENPNFPAKLVMTVHDQIDTICHKDVADKWKVIVKNCMEEAAIEVLPSGLLKADTNISERWEK